MTEPAPDDRPRARRGASVRIRLTLLLAVVLLPATLLLAYVGLEGSRLARQSAENDLARLGELVAASQAQRLIEARDLLAVIAQFPEVQAGDGAACSARLAEMLPLFGAYGGLGVVDAQGQMFCNTIPLTQPVDLSGRPWFQTVLATNAFAVGDYVVNRQGIPSLALGYPVHDADGRLIGAVSLGLNLRALNAAATNIPLPADADLLLFDAGGTVLAHSLAGDRWLGENHLDAAVVQQGLSGQPAVSEQLGLDGVPRVYTTLLLHHLGGQPLYLALGRPVGAVYAAAADVQRRNLAGIGLLVGLTLLTVWQASRFLLLRPVDELLRATRRLTVGDLNARTDLDHREGELGQLAYAFDHLAETLSGRDAARREAEAELRVSWEHYRRLVELSPDTIFVMQAGALVYINPAGARLLGAAQPEALLGRPVLTAFVHPHDRARLTAALQQLDTDRPMPLTEIRWQTPAGPGRTEHSLEVEVAATAITHDQQPAELVIVRDITARKQLERRRAALAETTQALAEAGANYQAVLNLVARQAGAHTGALAVLRVYAPGTQALIPAATYHADPQRHAALERLRPALEPALGSLSGSAAAGAQPVFLAEIDPVEVLTTAPPEVRNFFQQFPVYGLLGAPLANRQRRLGALSLLRDYPGQPFTQDDLAFLQELADRAALAIDNAQLNAAEQVARRAAEHAARQADQHAQRLARLQTITAAFSESLSLDQVLDVMIEQTMAALDADAGAVVLLVPDGHTLEVVRSLNGSPATVIHRFPLASDAPAAQVVRAGGAVWIESPAEYAARFPQFASIQPADFHSAAYLPLEVEGRRVGSLAVNFRAAHPFPPEERALLLAMARQGAQALQRTRGYESERAARAAAEAAQQRLAFLAEISRSLAASLDEASTLQTVLRLTLPALGDCGVIYRFTPAGAVEPAALAHHDPARAAQVRAWAAHHPPTLDPAGGLFAQAAQQRRPLYTEAVSEAAPDSALPLEAVLHAPLISGGRALGMLTLAYAGSGRRYGPAEREVVQEVTRQAAVALENAQLYAEAQRLNAELEARVTSRTAQLAAANAHLEAEVVERTRMEAELAQSHAQLRHVNAYMLAAREDERTLMAREIHDELGGMLTGLKMDVARTRQALADPAQAPEVTPRLVALSAMIDEMVQTVRRIATDLRPALLDDFGLAAAIEWQLQEFAKRSGLTCTLDSQVDELEWEAAASTGVFRAFQETLTNVARHAQASRIAVSLSQEDGNIVLRVQDDGRGITTSELAGLQSLGLAGMRERIEALQGRLTIRSEPGAGTTVLMQVPLARLLRPAAAN